MNDRHAGQTGDEDPVEPGPGAEEPRNVAVLRPRTAPPRADGPAEPVPPDTRAVLDALRWAARSGTSDDPEIRAALAAVARLGPGESSSSASVEVPLDTGRLAEVLDRVGVARRDARRSVPSPRPPGALADWARELKDLLREHDRDVLAEDFDVAGDVDPATWSLAVGEIGARALVERAGGSWDGGNYRNLYRAARLATGEETRHPVAPERASGVVSTAYVLSFLPTVDVLPRPRGRLRGRAALVTALIEAIRDPAPATEVLVGVGGMGKSAVALDVAHRVHAEGHPAFWIPAPDISALVAGLEQVALRLEVPLGSLYSAHRHASGTRDYALRLWALLDTSTTPWLILLDDVDEPGLGDEAWAHRSVGRGNVVVTTRFGGAGHWPGARVHELGELEEHEAAALLRDRLVLGDPAVGGTGPVGRAETAAQRLSSLLPGLPLALASVGDLLARSGQRDLEVWVDRVGSLSWEDAVSAVHGLCLDALGRHRDAGRHLLRLLVCFAPDEPLPESVLPDVVEREWAPGVDGVDQLVRVGLVERTFLVDGPCLRVHPAIAEHSRAEFGRGDRVPDLDVRAVDLLEEARLATDWGRPEDWPTVVALVPHVHELVTSPVFAHAGVAAEVGARVLLMADRTSAALMRSGRHESATALLDEALRCLGWLGAEHPAVLAARHTCCWMATLDRGGDLSRARHELEELRPVCERVLGSEHFTTVKVLDTLAWVLAEQRELAPARELLETVVRIRDAREPGSRYAHASHHRLAWVRVQMGEGREAVAEFERVLEERRALLGPDHLDVLSTSYRLAWALSKTGEHDEARRQFAVLLRQCEDALGADHALALMVRSRVAWAALRAGDLGVAHHVYTRLLPEQEKVLGADHRRVLVNAHNLAVLTLRLGDPCRAEEDLRSVVARREELLGSDHALSMVSREMHAWALFRSGRAEMADRELVAVLADRRRVLGEDHRGTFDARYRTARVVLHRGRLADAEGRLRALVADEVRVLGERDPRVLRARHAHALALALQGGTGQARDELRTVLEVQSRVLGAEHEETLATRDRLVWLHGIERGDDDLVVAARTVLEDRARVLGEDHPHTMTSRYREAWALLRANRFEAASRAYENVVEDLGRLRGPDHPHTLRARTGRLQLRRVGRLALRTVVGHVADALPEANDLVARLIRTQGTLAVPTLRAEIERAQVESMLGYADSATRRLRDVRARQRRVIGSNHPDVDRLGRLLGSIDVAPEWPSLDGYRVR